ncbi:14058_t:CDS:2, partial [Gigaspora margarita]
NPAAKYIYNQDIKDLLSIVNNTNTNDESCFWIKFAEIDQKDSFNNKKVFEGLYQIMAQVANLIFASLSSRAYNIFNQNFTGHVIQNIRLYCKHLPFVLHNPKLCFKNIAQVKKLVDTIKYTGPIIA